MDLFGLKEFTNGLKVLYAEDSLTARKITQKMLSEFFNDLDIAKDGQEAYDLYRNFYNENDRFYDIVFTDLEMPRMNGHELSEHILDFNSTQEIVVISGIEDFREAIELVNIGIKKFISKPAENEQLTRIIREVVQSMRKKNLKDAQQLEVEEYNQVLQEREEENKRVLDSKVKELEEFSSALEQSAIVIKTDTAGIVTYVNDLFCQISGYSEDEMIGANISIVNAKTKSNMFYKKLWNKISNKKTFKTLFENRRKDGSLYYIESTISPIINTDGEITEYISVSHNMTQLMSSLEARKEAEKSKDDFFINISHEMKTPLNAILGFSSILLNHVKDNAKALRMVNSILETGQDLTSLVESILEINKIKEHKFFLEEEAFSIEELLKPLEKQRKKALDKNQEFVVTTDKSIPETLVGDSKRISRIITIIVENAIKFSAKDTGSIKIDMFYDKKRESLICEVKDNGIGIEKENQKKVFGIQQLDGSMTRGYEGAGLGLNIAYNIINIMDGKISIKSIPSKGSIFTTEFPLKTKQIFRTFSI